LKQIEIQIQSKLFDNHDIHFNPQILNNNILIENIEKFYNISRIQIMPKDVTTIYDIIKNSPSRLIYINCNIPLFIHYTQFNSNTQVFIDSSMISSFFAYRNTADYISYLNIKQHDNINLYNPNNQTLVIDYLTINN